MRMIIILLGLLISFRANATGYSGTNPDLLYLYGIVVGLISLYFGIRFLIRFISRSIISGFGETPALQEDDKIDGV